MKNNYVSFPRAALLTLTATAALLARPVRADMEEVTFNFFAPPPEDMFSNPGGPVPVSVAGYYFFDSTQVTGGLLGTPLGPNSAPGAPGTAAVSFASGPSGVISFTYANGSVISQPYSAGFSLGNLFDSCGPFADCVWGVGQNVSVAQFYASPDPWGLILNGLSGESDEFDVAAPAERPGVGSWGFFATGSFQVHAVPEPGSLALFSLGLLGVFLLRARSLRALGR